MSRRTRRRRPPLAFALAAAGLAAAALLLIVAMDSAIARVADARGDAVVRRGARAQMLAARQTLRPGDEIACGERGICAFTFDRHATRVELTAGAILAIDGRDPDLLHLRSGVLVADVAPRPALRPLRIATPLGVATVLGTRLRIEIGDRVDRLSVDRGRVRLSRGGDDPGVEVAAGARATLRPGKGGSYAAIEAPAAAPASGWRALLDAPFERTWSPVWGAWSLGDGVLAGEAPRDRRFRVATLDSWQDLEIACEVAAEGCRHAELQIRDYAALVNLETLPPGWHRLRLRAQGTRIDAWLGDAPLEVERTGGSAVRGPIAFYGRAPGRLLVRDLRVRALAPEDAP